MKLLPQIRVAGIIYTIELVPHLRADLGFSGLSIPEIGKVKLDAGMCPDMLNATTIHEICEIIKSENQLKIKHHDLQCFATQFYQVINDNPEMFKNYE